jgi:flotillin
MGSILIYIGAGGVILLILLLVLLTAKYYKRAEMDEALVRSGSGGARVAIQGGMWVFPIFHHLQRVTLRTLKLDVKSSDKRLGMGVMRTSDHLPIIIDSEIYVRVPRKEEYVIAAATTLGEKADPKARLSGSRGKKKGEELDYEEDATTAIRELVEQKLKSAIRGVAAQLTLGEMHEDQLGFGDKVKDILEQDLLENGLEVESVCVESLDQEPLDDTKGRADSNVFDAQAVTALVQGVEQAATQRNAVEKDQTLERHSQDTEYEKQRLVLEQDRVFATEEQQRDVENKTVEILAAIERYEAETNRAKVELVEREQLVANKVIEQAATDLEVFQGECEKDKSVKIAQFEKEFQTEELERDRTVEKLEEDVKQDITLAEITRVQNVGTRAIESKQAVGVGLQQAEKEIEVAVVGRDETREVREREMQVAITSKEMAVANAETSTNQALAEAAEAKQAIETAALREQERAAMVVPAEMKALTEVKLKEAAIIEAEKERDAKALKAEGQKRSDVILAEGERDSIELKAEGQKRSDVITAEGEKRATVLQAEAEGESKIHLAKGVVAEANGQRDADVARGAGASALLALGQAEAESERLKNEALMIEREADLLTEKSVTRYLLSKNAPELVEKFSGVVAAAFKPLESIEGMRILQINTDGDGGTGDSPLTDVMRNIIKNAPAIPIINELLQFDDSKTTVQDVVEKVVGGAVDMMSNSPSEDS